MRTDICQYMVTPDCFAVVFGCHGQMADVRGCEDDICARAQECKVRVDGRLWIFFYRFRGPQRRGDIFMEDVFECRALRRSRSCVVLEHEMRS